MVPGKFIHPSFLWLGPDSPLYLKGHGVICPQFGTGKGAPVQFPASAKVLRPYLLFLAGLAFLAPADAATIQITNVQIVAPADPNNVPKYGKVELLVTLSNAAATKPYNPDPAAGGIDLTATFTAPDNSTRTVWGYYDGTKYRVRFAPTQTGAYSFTVKVKDSSGTATSGAGNFTCVASSSPGFVQIDGKHFRFTEGAAFFGIGHNNGYKDVLDTQPTFAQMTANGENLLEFWMAQPWGRPSWTTTRTPIENLEHGVGNYEQSACQYLDTLIANAEANHIYLLPAIWAHDFMQGAGAPFGSANWDDSNPYAGAFGIGAEDFYKTTSSGVDTGQWVAQKNYFRYLIARWGYSQSIIGWVSVVEIDGTNGWLSANQAQTLTWLSSVNTFFATNDFNRTNSLGQHPMTATLTDVVDPDPPSGAETIDTKGFIRSIDSYKKYTDSAGLVPLIAAQVQGMQAAGKPGFIAEFGANLHDGGSQPSHLHNGLWAATSAGAPMAPLVWCDDDQHYPFVTDVANMQVQYKFLSQFMSKISYVADTNITSATVSVTGGTFNAYGMRMTDRGFAWMRRTSGTISGQTLHVGTLVNGTYKVEWYDPNNDCSAPFHTDASVVVTAGSLNIAIPTLAQKDIAVQFKLAVNTPPTIDVGIAFSPSAPLAGDPVHFTVTASDADGNPLTYTWTFGDGQQTTTSTGAVNHTYSTQGSYTASVSVSDGTAQVTDSTSVDVGAANFAPSIQTFTYAPVPPVMNTSITFDVTATDPENDTLFYTWTFGDGQQTTTSTGTVNHTYASAGPVTVSVAVSDGLHQVTANKSLTIKAANQAPVIQGSGISFQPQPPIVGVNIQFSVLASDPDSDPLTYAWDFGDGNTTTTSTGSVTHSYASAGNYAASVTVSDGSLQAVSNTSVNVAAQGTVTPTAVLLYSNYVRAKQDYALASCYIGGLPQNFNPKGVACTVDLGGAALNFTLDAKGTARTAAGAVVLTRSGTRWVFSVAYNRANLHANWSDEGFVSGQSNGYTHSLGVTVTLGSLTFVGSKSLRYTGTSSWGLAQ